MEKQCNLQSFVYNTNSYLIFKLAGTFEQYYGGTVINLDQQNGIMYHVLRVADNEVDVIVGIDVVTGQTVFSKLTDVRHLHNLGLYNLGY